jgi:teichoic acid transport system permease protein
VLISPPSPGRDQLIELGTRQPTVSYLRDLWARRHFALSLADNDLRAKHMNSLLGQFWHLLNPALMILVYFLIFGVVLDARRGIDNYVTFLVIGVVLFRFSQNTIIGSAQCITKNLGLIRSIQFPRALVPISVVLENLFALVPAMALVLVTALLDGANLGTRTLLLPLIILVTALFTLGVSLAAARAGAALSDLSQVLPHLFRILFYMSGVLFAVDQFIANPTVRSLFALNPFFCAISTARWALMGEPLSSLVPLSLAVWTVLALATGLTFFRRAEHRFGG